MKFNPKGHRNPFSLFSTFFMAVIVVAFIGTSCSPDSNGSFSGIGKNSWGYHLFQYLFPNDLNRIENSTEKIWVIDYSMDGTEMQEFSNETIQNLKKNGNIILSYLSIGEAEKVRFYFEAMDQELVEEENPNWPDNFRVQYWQTEWQNIILNDTPEFGRSYLNRIIDAGFDGVYLDIVDAYTYEEEEDKFERADEMIQFISAIRETARKRNPGFLVIPQNAPFIYEEGTLANLYWNSIDGIGLEDVFFKGSNLNNNPLNIQTEIVQNFADFQSRGKIILSVEYISDPDKINTYFDLAKTYGIIPLAAERDLAGHLIFAK